MTSKNMNGVQIGRINIIKNKDKFPNTAHRELEFPVAARFVLGPGIEYVKSRH